jgi:hypothetical protein
MEGDLTRRPEEKLLNDDHALFRIQDLSSAWLEETLQYFLRGEAVQEDVLDQVKLLLNAKS